MHKSLFSLLIALCIVPSLSADNPIIFDYHGVLFGKDSHAVKKELFSYFMHAHNKFSLVTTVLNPAFVYSLIGMVRDENQAIIIDALTEKAPILAQHRDQLFAILNNEFPIAGMHKLLHGLSQAGIPLVLASNMRLDTYRYLAARDPRFFAQFSYVFPARQDGHGIKPETYYFKQLWDAVCERYALEGSVIFIDDSKENIDAAFKANQKWGTHFDPILFVDKDQLIQELIRRGHSVEYV